MLRDNNFRFLLGKNEAGEIICHLAYSESCNAKLTSERVKEICQKLSRKLIEYKYIIAVGSIVNGFEKIHNSFSNAKKGCERSFYLKPPCVVDFKENKDASLEFTKEGESEFLNSLRKNQMDVCHDILSKIFKGFSDNSTIPIKFTKDYFTRLVKILFDEASKRKININDERNFSDVIFEKIISAKYLYKIQDFMILSTNEYFTAIKIMKDKNLNVERIVEFIHKNYYDPKLSLNYLAEELNISTSYMCILFKKYKAITLNQYIIEFKISKAKDMLKNTNSTVKFISEKVGYNDCNYFIKVFKKETGLTPIEFRECEKL